MIPEFDWCHFCKHDDHYTAKCRECTYKEDEKPSHFEEKASVTAYRKAIE